MLRRAFFKVVAAIGLGGCLRETEGHQIEHEPKTGAICQVCGQRFDDGRGSPLRYGRTCWECSRPRCRLCGGLGILEHANRQRNGKTLIVYTACHACHSAA